MPQPEESPQTRYMRNIQLMESQFFRQMSSVGAQPVSPLSSKMGVLSPPTDPSDSLSRSPSPPPPIPPKTYLTHSPQTSLFRTRIAETEKTSVSGQSRFEKNARSSVQSDISASASPTQSRKPFFKPNTSLKSHKSLLEQASQSVARPALRSDSVEEDELRDSVGTLDYFGRKGYRASNDAYNSLLFKNSTDSMLSADDSPVMIENLPESVRLIVDSRPSGQVHDLDYFDGAQYSAFWLITEDEAQALTDWNSLEFHRQNAIFELFLLLRKLRINLKRMVFHYGPAFREAKNLTADQEADFQKTFVPLGALYEYLEKLVRKRLKPAFDNHFFVNDRYVLDCLKNWLSKLERDYEYISRSMVYLAKIAANERFREWIEVTEQTDELALGNNYLASARELCHSYLLQAFAPMRLMVLDLKKLYAKMEDDRLVALAQDIFNLLNNINKISDFTTDLDKKIKLNEKLVCTDYLYLEMVDLFNAKRKLRVPVDINLRTAISSESAMLYLLDNYILPLVKREHKEASYLLNKPPIALQYLEYTIQEENGEKTLILKDTGNCYTYNVRNERVDAPTLFNNFVKDIPKYKDELFTKLSKTYELKLINGTSFQSPVPYYEYTVPPIERKELDLVQQALAQSKFKPYSVPPIANTQVLSIDTFRRGRELFFVVGTADGLYMGRHDQPATWKKVCSYPDAVKLTIVHEEVVFVLLKDKLYKVDTKNMYECYEKNLLCNSSLYQVAKGVNSFEVGTQTVRRGPIVMECDILFCWTDKKIMFSIVTASNGWKLKFESMRPIFKVRGLQLLHPTDFVINHVNENNPIFYLSNLNTMGNTQLNKMDTRRELKSRIRGERPIAAFKQFVNDKNTDYDLLLVYSRYCMFVKYSKDQIVSISRAEILRFNFEVQDATYDSYEQILVVCGEQNVEIWRILKDRQAKSELIGCVIGSQARLLNKTPGKIIISVMNNERYAGKGNQLLLHLRKRKQ
ncbi:hypothetical protein KL948_001381 [Ogataea haglerorum]|nr:hypothetical protein KL948_001381 [Ogataea haglerorum]